MNQAIQIVLGSEALADGFQSVVDSVARERRYLASVEGFPKEESLKFVRKLAAGAGVQYFALDGKEVVGWCDITRPEFQGFEHSGSLGMGVLKEYRGRGIGKSLLRETMSAAVKMGISRIGLEVFSDNEAAIKLYEDFGFEVEGIKRRARIIDDIENDILCMAWFKDGSGIAT
jgi:ribosomal protein S18 acetylase RimI-like enzyme